MNGPQSGSAFTEMTSSHKPPPHASSALKRNSESDPSAQRNKKARHASEASDACHAFYESLQELPFQDLPASLRELALETYIKETMGMSSSLQSLEVQLRVNQAAGGGSEGGAIVQQSVALLAAVSQLRADAWGLSQLRLSQYAAMTASAQGGKAHLASRRTTHAGAEEFAGNA